jgi:hypothetical protein
MPCCVAPIAHVRGPERVMTYRSGSAERAAGVPPKAAQVLALQRTCGPCQADSCCAANDAGDRALFDDFVGAREYRLRNIKTQRLGRVEIDHKLELSGL